MTAEEYLNGVSYDDLKRALKEIGQEENATKIASAIIKVRPLATTDDLSNAVRSVTSSFKWNKVLSRVFMVIRCVVNDELGAIDRFLSESPKLLNHGGRILCISFDSNQDSRVKNSFRSQANPCECPPTLPVCVCNRVATMKVITPRALKPTDAEIDLNKRSRSARLRIAEKI
jgi:16S rRNA (cytosine1402-N4)-methyltransferase